jgi:hypothetical protein
MRSFVHDQYAALNFRDTLGDGETRPPNVPSWVSDLSDARRMAAYRILAAYLDNCARYYLPETMWQRPLATSIVGPDQYGHAVAAQTAASKSPAEKFREYGDPRLLVEQAAALVLGESQEITVPDAAPLPDDAPDDEKAAQVRAAQFADWLAGWADDERLLLRLYEQEDDSVGLGDGVLVLGWDAEAGRTRLRKFDIESYFPVLTGDQDADEFPNRVHFAWVECPRDGVEILHRLTYDRRRCRTVRPAPTPTPTSRRGGRSTRPTPPGTCATCGRTPASTTSHVTTPRSSCAPTARPSTSSTSVWTSCRSCTSPTRPAAAGTSAGRCCSRSRSSSTTSGSPTPTWPRRRSGRQHAARVSPAAPVPPPASLSRTGGGVELAGRWGREAARHVRCADRQIAYVNYLLERLSVNTRLAEALLGRVKPNEVPSGYALGSGSRRPAR